MQQSLEVRSAAPNRFLGTLKLVGSAPPSAKFGMVIVAIPSFKMYPYRQACLSRPGALGVIRRG